MESFVIEVVLLPNPDDCHCGIIIPSGVEKMAINNSRNPGHDGLSITLGLVKCCYLIPQDHVMAACFAFNVMEIPNIKIHKHVEYQPKKRGVSKVKTTNKYQLEVALAQFQMTYS
jgi:hypothetical protein